MGHPAGERIRAACVLRKSRSLRRTAGRGKRRDERDRISCAAAYPEATMSVLYREQPREILGFNMTEMRAELGGILRPLVMR